MAGEDQTRAPVGRDAARRGIAYLNELQPQLRSAAVLAPDGGSIEASGDPSGWDAPARRLLDAAGLREGEEDWQLHVATTQGEVFGVRAGGAVMLAVTERFVLASLLLHDLRMVIRDMLGEG